MKFSEHLTEMDTCPEAVEWVGNRDLKKAWNECDRADWMFWLVQHLDIEKIPIVLAACDIAETTLKYVPDGEDRPAIAIQTSRNWCAGTATIEDCRAAAGATTWATAWAAAAAGATAWAATTWAAAAAAEAAAEAVGAGAGAGAAHANIVRKHITYEMIAKAWRER